MLSFLYLRIKVLMPRSYESIICLCLNTGTRILSSWGELIGVGSCSGWFVAAPFKWSLFTSLTRASLFAQDLGVGKQIGVFVDALPELEAVIKPAEISEEAFSQQSRVSNTNEEVQFCSSGSAILHLSLNATMWVTSLDTELDVCPPHWMIRA